MATLFQFLFYITIPLLWQHSDDRKKETGKHIRLLAINLGKPS